jgi:solute:Na+ symporter, SSS family
MNESILPFGKGGIAFIGCYLTGLLLIGWMGRRARKDHSLRDFYLGGKGVGLVVLLLTLYATQYSGNTMFGFSGKAYRVGFSWITSVHFMTAIIVGYLLFAPQLHRLSQVHGFITPNDFLHYRYQHRGMDILAPILMILALGNYLLAQLMAMGRALQGLTSMPSETAYIVGVLLLGSIMLVYETLGGFRAVAWTDVLQGVILMIGFSILIYLIHSKYGSLAAATQTLLEGDHETRMKALPPGDVGSRNWLSYVLLFGLGASLYPQALQRIYAARSSRVLRNSLVVMAFLPMTTAWIAVMVGVTGAANVPGLDAIQSDRILTILCREVQQSSALGYGLVIVLFAAILGALMSTADSCMLTISSMATKDIYLRFIQPNAKEARLTALGKWISWVLVGLLAWIAIYMNSRTGKPTLVRLLDLKFDMLVQLAPAFMLGMHWKKLHGSAVFWGLLSGLATTFLLYGNAWVKESGFHQGLFGLVVNLVVAISLSFILDGRRNQPTEI